MNLILKTVLSFLKSKLVTGEYKYYGITFIKTENTQNNNCMTHIHGKGIKIDTDIINPII